MDVFVRSCTSWTMNVGFFRRSSRPSIYAQGYLCFSKGYFAVKKSKQDSLTLK